MLYRQHILGVTLPALQRLLGVTLPALQRLLGVTLSALQRLECAAGVKPPVELAPKAHGNPSQGQRPWNAPHQITAR